MAFIQAHTALYCGSFAHAILEGNETVLCYKRHCVVACASSVALCLWNYHVCYEKFALPLSFPLSYFTVYHFQLRFMRDYVCTCPCLVSACVNRTEGMPTSLKWLSDFYWRPCVDDLLQWATFDPKGTGVMLHSNYLLFLVYFSIRWTLYCRACPSSHIVLLASVYVHVYYMYVHT